MSVYWHKQSYPHFALNNDQKLINAGKILSANGVLQLMLKPDDRLVDEQARLRGQQSNRPQAQCHCYDKTDPRSRDRNRHWADNKSPVIQGANKVDDGHEAKNDG